VSEIGSLRTRPQQRFSSRRRTIAITLLIALVLALVVRWYLAGDTVRILSYRVDAGGIQLGIGLETCSASDLRADVDEDAAQVAIEVRKQRTSGSGDDCMDVIEIELERPLGTRLVVDRTTGLTIPPAG